MATTPNPASFRNLPNTLHQLTEQSERDELEAERSNDTPAPRLSDADQAAEAINAFDPRTTMLKGESIDVALGALGVSAPEVAVLHIANIGRSMDGLTSNELVREEFNAQLDGTHEVYTEIEEQDIEDVERKHSHRTASQDQDKAEDPFARLEPGVDTEILLSNLLRETHHALSVGANEERVAEQLTRFLKDVEPQHPALHTTASDFLTSGISKTSDVVDALMMQAKENVLRDADPPRTLQQHIREVLKEGDDPANTLQVINQWHNPANDAARAEEIRTTIAQEWARSLATEGQTPLVIRDSLTLHLPDSDTAGQTHVAVSVRVHEEVNRPHEPERRPNKLDSADPDRQEGRPNNLDSADPNRQEGHRSSNTSVERNPESPRR